MGAYVNDKKLLESSLQNMYSLVYVKCTDVIGADMDIMKYHEDVLSDICLIGLLTNINTIIFQLKTTKYMPNSLHYCNSGIHVCSKYWYNTVPDY